MRDDVKLYLLGQVMPGGGLQEVVFGVGVDRSLWMPAMYLGLGPEALKALQRKHGEVVMYSEADGATYVEARALVLNATDPVIQEAMVRIVRDLTGRLRPVESSDDTAGSN